MPLHDEVWMRRALQLAGGSSHTWPNPRVGAVVVARGEVVGEGAHEGPGTPHAEAVALEAAAERAGGATMYVTLEPCAHFGRMPPCVPQVVGAGITRVVVAMEDPDERVRGRGVSELQSAGIDVALGTGRSDAIRLNAPYVKHRTTGTPYVRLKLALSLDGRLAARDGSSRWLTGPRARVRVHELRAAVDAVLVGSGTVLSDDPRLTARDVAEPRSPMRVVVDTRGRVTPEAAIFHPDERVVIATGEECPHDVQTAWKEAGAEVLVLPRGDGGVDLAALLVMLGDNDVVDLLCEGGATLGSALLRADQVDELELHYAPLLLGAGGPSLDALGVTTVGDAARWKLATVEGVGDDVIARYRPHDARSWEKA